MLYLDDMLLSQTDWKRHSAEPQMDYYLQKK